MAATFDNTSSLSLEQINLQGLGRFDLDGKATFSINTQNLPAPWEYLYQNRKVLLKVDQHGPIYAQADPPSDILLFRRESFQKTSSWLVWIVGASLPSGAFTNFWRPAPSGNDPASQPDKIKITYSPAKAIYDIEHEGVGCVTELFVPEDQCSVCMSVSLTNLRNEAIKLSAIPVLRPYMNPAQLAPWDRPEWYLRSAFCKEQYPGFSLQLMNMNSRKQDRRYGSLWSSGENLCGAEVDYERFVGQGTFENPQAILDDQLRLKPENAKPWGQYDETNNLYAYPSVNALRYDMMLDPGETKTIRQVLAVLPHGQNHEMPSPQVAGEPACWLDDGACEKEIQTLEQKFDRLFSLRQVTTPDPALNRYANEWLPLQLDWVCSLDRGWPSGMRGSRDSAQDFTALVGLDAAWCRRIIETMFSCQRTDGWFPRQYAASGRKGKHDLRSHVDAGNCVIELLYEYLCTTKDWTVFETTLPWLDDDRADTILEHTLRALNYFLLDDNIGEHGLCKIREGDWLDAVNTAGLEGRGESVTVTCQTVLSLAYMSQIIEKLKTLGAIPASQADQRLGDYVIRSQQLKHNLLAHALNGLGFFNSVFNDNGRWIFSDKDPDGKCRPYIPANAFAVIAGIADDKTQQSILNHIETLKCPHGYRLFAPPMGDVPIDKVGRSASGDLPAGSGENATVYNHGSHGFLARALAVIGDGDRLYDVLKFLLPYDQQKHPIDRAQTAPYGITNSYLDIPGYPGRGGMAFLTGSTGYAMRIVYSWLFGIRPQIEGLVIDPCLPRSFDKLQADFTYQGKAVHLDIHNPNANCVQLKKLTLNGRSVGGTMIEPASGRAVFIIEDHQLDPSSNKITAIL